MTTQSRTQQRQAWREEWKNYRVLKPAGPTRRPAHNRQARRNFWREEWQERNSAGSHE